MSSAHAMGGPWAAHDFKHVRDGLKALLETVAATWGHEHHHHRGHRHGEERHRGPRGPRPFPPFEYARAFFGPGFPHGRGGRWGGRPKAKRGDVRAAILALLAEEPRNGYQIIQEIAERSHGGWKPSPGAVYP